MAVDAIYMRNFVLNLRKIPHNTCIILGENFYGKTDVKFTEYFTPELSGTRKMDGVITEIVPRFRDVS